MAIVWRAMNSLLVLRDQVNLIAPTRSKASDGLVGDPEHQATTSDHNPHFVAGVGDNIVTALDLTHDPARGFNSYFFADVLRAQRDRRIKYVISNHRIFSSYAVGSRPAWVWGSYNGVDPHTNHVHVSVLDATISDTRTPWDLGVFDMLTDDDVKKIWSYFLGASGPNTGQAQQQTIQGVNKLTAAVPADLVARLNKLEEQNAAILLALGKLGNGVGGTPAPSADEVAKATVSELTGVLIAGQAPS
jgi:hypothetical protein